MKRLFLYILNILAIASKPCIPIVSILSGNTFIRIGKLQIHGDKEFVCLAEKAFCLLKEEDESVVEALAKTYGFFLNDKNIFLNAYRWDLLVVSGNYTAWQEKGLIAALLLFHFGLVEKRKGLWYLADAKNSAAIEDRIHFNANQWMRNRQFPKELIV